MKIKRSTLGGLRNVELVQFISDVCTTLDDGEYDLTTLGLDATIADIKTNLEAFSKRVSTSNRYKNSDYLNRAEQNRTNLVRQIYKVVEAQAQSPVEEIARTANSIKAVFDRHGGIKIAYMPVDEKSVIINKIIDALSFAYSTQWTDKLSLTESVARLGSENNSYIYNRNSKTSYIGSIERGETVGLRKSLEASYSKLTDLLNAHCVLNDASMYKSIMEFINQHLQNYFTTVKVRRTIAQGKEENEIIQELVEV